jgi:hypothetical protein
MRRKQHTPDDPENQRSKSGVRLHLLGVGAGMGILAVVAGMAGFEGLAGGLTAGLLIVLLLLPWAEC